MAPRTDGRTGGAGRGGMEGTYEAGLVEFARLGWIAEPSEVAVPGAYFKLF